jgi:hypothetical protein
VKLDFQKERERWGKKYEEIAYQNFSKHGTKNQHTSLRISGKPRIGKFKGKHTHNKHLKTKDRIKFKQLQKKNHALRTMSPQ